MMVFWTAGFVLLTLAINAPMLPFVLRVTGLSKVGRQLPSSQSALCLRTQIMALFFCLR
jgi:hypothetical protein